MADRSRSKVVVVGRALVVVGALGVVLTLVGIVVAVRVLSSMEGAVTESITLSADALDVVDASVAVTDRVVTSLAEALATTEATTDEVAAGVGDAAAVLDATAALVEVEVAGSLDAVVGALPALVDVAAVIDRTLSVASSLPFGPDYDPSEPFDDSVRALQVELDGLPGALREQADLARDASASLAEVERGVDAIGRDLGDLELAMQDAHALLADYGDTTREARGIVERTADDLAADIGFAQLFVVVLLLTMAVANLAPLAVGWLLLHPEHLPDVT